MDVVKNQIHRSELRSQIIGIEEREADALSTQRALELAQAVPDEMAAQALINLVHCNRLWSAEQGLGFRRRKHADQYQMLMAQHIHRTQEGLCQDRVVQLRQKDQQRAAAKTEPQEGAQLVEIPRHQARMQVVEGLLASAVMTLDVFGANEAVYAIAATDY